MSISGGVPAVTYSKSLIAFFGVVSVLGAIPATAQTPRTDCVTREGNSGTWRTGRDGKWERCEPAALGRPAQTGMGVHTALLVGGVAAAVGLAIALSHGKHSASP